MFTISAIALSVILIGALIAALAVFKAPRHNRAKYGIERVQEYFLEDSTSAPRPKRFQIVNPKVPSNCNVRR